MKNADFYEIIITVSHDSFGRRVLRVRTEPSGEISPEELREILTTLLD